MKTSGAIEGPLRGNILKRPSLRRNFLKKPSIEKIFSAMWVSQTFQIEPNTKRKYEAYSLPTGS